jgi:hypothetical protein
MSDNTQQQIDPETRLTVTMTAQQWFTLQNLLAEPFRVSHQFIQEIQRQCLLQARSEHLPSHMPMRPNGGVAETSNAPRS